MSDRGGEGEHDVAGVRGVVAHDAVRAWCTAQHRELTGLSWEIYADPDPQTGHFDIAVYWQLA